MKVIDRALSGIKPYPNNPRSIPLEAIDSVAASIEEFGWRQPIVVDTDGVIIVGHTRYLAAKKLGLKKAPVHVMDATDEQAKAFRIADNRTGEFSEWDMDQLSEELLALDSASFNMLDFGISEAELAAALAPNDDELNDPDEVLEPPAEIVTQPGDIWTMGKHRLICGDSTDPETVARVLDGAKPNLLITDPPYGVNYNADWRNRTLTSDGRKHGGRAIGKVFNDDRCEWGAAYSLHPGNVIYIWAGSPGIGITKDNLESSGFEMRNLLIWNKSELVIGRGHYQPKHENCLYFTRKGRAANWIGGRKQTTVWDIAKNVKSETGHSTQKPVECMERPIRNHKGDVYDPFVGSGTTIIAAERQARRCYAIEISAAYCDICVARWETYTGEKAKRQS